MSLIKADHAKVLVRDHASDAESTLSRLSSSHAETLDFALTFAGKFTRADVQPEGNQQTSSRSGSAKKASTSFEMDSEGGITETLEHPPRNTRRASADDLSTNGPVAMSAPPVTLAAIADVLSGGGTQGKSGESTGQESSLAPPADARMALLREPGDSQKTPAEGQKLPSPEIVETDLPGEPKAESTAETISDKDDSTVPHKQDLTGENAKNAPKKGENGLADPMEGVENQTSQPNGRTLEKLVSNPGGMPDATAQLPVNSKMTMNDIARPFEQELPSEALAGSEAHPGEPIKSHGASIADDKNAATVNGNGIASLMTAGPVLVAAAQVQEAGRGLAAVAKIEQAVAVHALELQLLNATTLHAVIQPTPGTELHLRVHWNGQNVEAQLRGGAGSEDFLKSHWGQLQESLGTRGITLAPIDSTATPVSSHGGSSAQFADRQENQHAFQRQEPAMFDETQDQFRHNGTDAKTTNRLEDRTAGNVSRILESWA